MDKTNERKRKNQTDDTTSMVIVCQPSSSKGEKRRSAGSFLTSKEGRSLLKTSYDLHRNAISKSRNFTKPQREQLYQNIQDYISKYSKENVMVDYQQIEVGIKNMKNNKFGVERRNKQYSTYMKSPTYSRCSQVTNNEQPPIPSSYVNNIPSPLFASQTTFVDYDDDVSTDSCYSVNTSENNNVLPTAVDYEEVEPLSQNFIVQNSTRSQHVAYEANNNDAAFSAAQNVHPQNVENKDGALPQYVECGAKEIKAQSIACSNIIQNASHSKNVNARKRKQNVHLSPYGTNASSDSSSDEVEKLFKLQERISLAAEELINSDKKLVKLQENKKQRRESFLLSPHGTNASSDSSSDEVEKLIKLQERISWAAKELINSDKKLVKLHEKKIKANTDTPPCN